MRLSNALPETPDAPDPLAGRLLPMGLACFGGMLSMRFCDAMIPALAQEFATTPGRAAQTISAFALAYGLMQLVFGLLADRYGKYRVVTCAALACTAGPLVAVWAPGLDALAASRALAGATAAGIVPVTMAWIGDNVGYAQRQATLARLLGFTVFGMIAGQWLGGVVADSVGWRTGFGLLALFFAFAGGLLWWRGRGLPEPPPAQRAPGGFVGGMRTVWARPWARFVMAVALVEGALAYSAISFVPNDLHSRHGLSVTHAGAVLALYGVGGLTYSRLAARLLGRLGERGLVLGGGLMLCLAMGLLAWLPAWWVALPACFAGGLGFYMFHNTLQTNATQMAPAARGTGVALFACALFLGQSVGVVAAAWVVDHSSAVPVFLFSGVSLLLLAVVFASRLIRT